LETKGTIKTISGYHPSSVTLESWIQCQTAWLFNTEKCIAIVAWQKQNIFSSYTF